MASDAQYRIAEECSSLLGKEMVRVCSDPRGPQDAPPEVVRIDRGAANPLYVRATPAALKAVLAASDANALLAVLAADAEDAQRIAFLHAY